MTLEEKRGVGLNPHNNSRLTEHLAPICVLLDMPLLLLDEKCCVTAERLYPGLKTLYVHWEELSPEYLIENFDVFFQSEPWNRERFYKTFQELEKKYGKIVRNIHCPHGFSDKLYWLAQCVLEDITLVYGDNMLDMFKEMGLFHCLNAYVKTGNYRYVYYLQHKEHFDRIVEEEVWSKFSQERPTILYAPTCNDVDQNTSFLDANPIFEKLPSSFNLIVKIHPVLEETDPQALYRTMGQYEKNKNIVFVKDLSLVYPILARSDIYVGDMSSVGYDFLTFNRPMFFLNQKKRDSKKDRNLFLFRCGVEVQPEQYSEIYSIIESALPFDAERFSRIRKEVYQYTFGDLVPFPELKKAILQSYKSPKKAIPENLLT